MARGILVILTNTFNMKGLLWLVGGAVLGGLLVSLILQPGPQPPPPVVTMTFTTRESTTITSTLTTITTEYHTTTVFQGPARVSDICFSRVSTCDILLVKLIDAAKSRVHVAVYSFTNDVIADALIRARMRGVEVLVVMDAEQAAGRGSEYSGLKATGVEVRLDGNPYLMHHKFMVVDDSIVVTGSYNWSAAAEERNDENLVVIVWEEANRLFETEFQRVWSQAFSG